VVNKGLSGCAPPALVNPTAIGTPLASPLFREGDNIFARKESFMVAIKVLLLSSVLLIAYTSRALEAGNAERQPVFLVCPHTHGYDAMSLYVDVDKNDKSKILALGLEYLKGQNSKDSTYEAVLRAREDQKVEREHLGTLRAAEFGRGQIEVKKDDAMRISVTPSGKDLRLSLSMRISLDGR